MNSWTIHPTWGLVWLWCWHRIRSTAAIPCDHRPRRGLEVSWQEYTVNCLASRVVSGVRRLCALGQAARGLKPLGIGVDSEMGLVGRWGVVSGEGHIRSAVEYLLCLAFFLWWSPIQLLSLHHVFSFHCLTVPSLISLSRPPAAGLCHMQKQGPSGVEVLIAFGAAVRPIFFSVLGLASAVPEFPVPLEYEQCYSAVWIRIRFGTYERAHQQGLC